MKENTPSVQDSIDKLMKDLTCTKTLKIYDPERAERERLRILAEIEKLEKENF